MATKRALTQYDVDSLRGVSRWLREDAVRRAAEAERCCAQCIQGAATRNAENLASADEIYAKLSDLGY